MNLKLHHWIASGLVAIVFHACLALVLSQNSQGALAEGLHGIEIDLGMLGDFGEQLESQVTNVETTIKRTEPIKEHVVDQNIEQVVEVEIVQESELLVFDEPPDDKVDSELPEDLAAEITTKEETILVDERVLAELDDTQNPEQPDTAQTQTKQTTGEANSLHNGGQSGVDQSYLAKLLAQLAQHKRYPISSRRKAEEGVAVLDFEISRTGRVLVSHIQKSSGFNALDKAVLVMLKRAEPFPPVPPDIKGEPIRFTLPIAFRLNG